MVAGLTGVGQVVAAANTPGQNINTTNSPAARAQQQGGGTPAPTFLNGGGGGAALTPAPKATTPAVASPVAASAGTGGVSNVSINHETVASAQLGVVSGNSAPPTLSGFSPSSAQQAGYQVINDSNATGGFLLLSGGNVYNEQGNFLYSQNPNATSVTTTATGASGIGGGQQAQSQQVTFAINPNLGQSLSPSLPSYKNTITAPTTYSGTGPLNLPDYATFANTIEPTLALTTIGGVTSFTGSYNGLSYAGSLPVAVGYQSSQTQKNEAIAYAYNENTGYQNYLQTPTGQVAQQVYLSQLGNETVQNSINTNIANALNQEALSGLSAPSSLTPTVAPGGSFSGVVGNQVYNGYTTTSTSSTSTPANPLAWLNNTPSGGITYGSPTSQAGKVGVAGNGNPSAPLTLEAEGTFNDLGSSALASESYNATPAGFSSGQQQASYAYFVGGQPSSYASTPGLTSVSLPLATQYSQSQVAPESVKTQSNIGQTQLANTVTQPQPISLTGKASSSYPTTTTSTSDNSSGGILNNIGSAFYGSNQPYLATGAEVYQNGTQYTVEKSGVTLANVPTEAAPPIVSQIFGLPVTFIENIPAYLENAATSVYASTTPNPSATYKAYAAPTQPYTLNFNPAVVERPTQGLTDLAITPGSYVNGTQVSYAGNIEGISSPQTVTYAPGLGTPTETVATGSQIPSAQTSQTLTTQGSTKQTLNLTPSQYYTQTSPLGQNYYSTQYGAIASDQNPYARALDYLNVGGGQIPFFGSGIKTEVSGFQQAAPYVAAGNYSAAGPGVLQGVVGAGQVVLTGAVGTQAVTSIAGGIAKEAALSGVDYITPPAATSLASSLTAPATTSAVLQYGTATGLLSGGYTYAQTGSPSQALASGVAGFGETAGFIYGLSALTPVYQELKYQVQGGVPRGVTAPSSADKFNMFKTSDLSSPTQSAVDVAKTPNGYEVLNQQGIGVEVAKPPEVSYGQRIGGFQVDSSGVASSIMLPQETGYPLEISSDYLVQRAPLYTITEGGASVPSTVSASDVLAARKGAGTSAKETLTLNPGLSLQAQEPTLRYAATQQGYVPEDAYYGKVTSVATNQAPVNIQYVGTAEPKLGLIDRTLGGSGRYIYSAESNPNIGITADTGYTEAATGQGGIYYYGNSGLRNVINQLTQGRYGNPTLTTVSEGEVPFASSIQTFNRNPGRSVSVVSVESLGKGGEASVSSGGGEIVRTVPQVNAATDIGNAQAATYEGYPGSALTTPPKGAYLEPMVPSYFGGETTPATVEFRASEPTGATGIVTQEAGKSPSGFTKSSATYVTKGGNPSEGTIFDVVSNAKSAQATDSISAPSEGIAKDINLNADLVNPDTGEVESGTTSLKGGYLMKPNGDLVNIQTGEQILHGASTPTTISSGGLSTVTAPAEAVQTQASLAATSAPSFSSLAAQSSGNLAAQITIPGVIDPAAATSVVGATNPLQTSQSNVNALLQEILTINQTAQQNYDKQYLNYYVQGTNEVGLSPQTAYQQYQGNVEAYNTELGKINTSVSEIQSALQTLNANTSLTAQQYSDQYATIIGKVNALIALENELGIPAEAQMPSLTTFDVGELLGGLQNELTADNKERQELLERSLSETARADLERVLGRSATAEEIKQAVQQLTQLQQVEIQRQLQNQIQTTTTTPPPTTFSPPGPPFLNNQPDSDYLTKVAKGVGGTGVELQRTPPSVTAITLSSIPGVEESLEANYANLPKIGGRPVGLGQVIRPLSLANSPVEEVATVSTPAPVKRKIRV